jgi:nitrite reductase/ring-hydroxylating ferredoxin subunit
MKPQRSYCIAARLASGAPPQGMSINAGSPTRSIRSFGDLLIVGGESHSAGARDATPERFARLEEFARAHWDVEAVTHRWSAQDPVHYDHLPVIGPYRPGSSRLWVASGFMKWGFSSATFAAKILCDRIGGRDNPWAATFSPTRVSPRSLHEVGQLGGKFTLDLVGDRLRPPEAPSAGDIPAGEARVLGDGLGRKGVYRDEDGTLHAVSVRCTHMGCLLRFNGAERSWDCPCHGSRFDVDGAVLEGPAVQPLERREP